MKFSRKVENVFVNINLHESKTIPSQNTIPCCYFLNKTISKISKWKTMPKMKVCSCKQLANSIIVVPPTVYRTQFSSRKENNFLGEIRKTNEISPSKNIKSSQSSVITIRLVGVPVPKAKCRRSILYSFTQIPYNCTGPTMLSWVLFLCSMQQLHCI